MKRTIIITTCLFSLFASCRQSEKSPESSPETPVALQEKSSSEILFSKSRYDDLVESLYAELIEKNPALKELEKTIDDLKDQKSDSVKPFTKFDSKNTSYYNSANEHLTRISDSILRIKMNTIINNSLNNYNNKIARHQGLISMLNTKDIDLKNLHIILKIVRTLPMIEKYQSENIPSIKPIEKTIKNFDKAIQQTDTLVKK